VIVAVFAAVAAVAPTAPSQAAFPGGDGRIAFMADWIPMDCGDHSCEEEVTGLYSIRPDGTGRHTLRRCSRRDSDTCDLRQAAWSPDGRRIVFTQNSSIWVMNANGSHAHPVYKGAGDTPSWSPDGRHIVFTDLYAYSGWITIMRPDGTHRHRVNGNRDNSEPVWSASGLIAYTHYPRSVAPTSIIIRRPDGRLVSRIESRYGVSNPDFSPDGKLIAFDRNAGDDRSSIWRSRLDGSHGREVVRNGAQPAWSPSGRFIAYLAAGPGPGYAGEIFVARRDGSHAHQVGPSPRGRSHPPGDYVEPAWQPLPLRR
jgi:Tol biopolymer transport system component